MTWNILLTCGALAMIDIPDSDGVRFPHLFNFFFRSQFFHHVLVK